MREALELGAYDFIQKPSFEFLDKIVRNALKLGIGLDNSSLEEITTDILTDYQKPIPLIKNG